MKERTRRTKKASPLSRKTQPTSSAIDDWREATLSRLRELIMSADPEIIEEWKWKMPSNPEGVPVWSHDGIICVGNTLKRAVRLTFPGGIEMRDPSKLFNTRLDSRAVRAIDFYEGVTLNEPAIRKLIREAARVNASIVRKRAARAKSRKP
jgi:hypothetical protein